MVRGTSRVNDRIKAARERAVGETQSRQSKLHFTFFFFFKSLHLQKIKPENKCINASPKDSLNWSIYSFSVIEKQTERFKCYLRISPSLVFHEVIFIDNWRVLHGRESFTGLRQLCGCYLTRDDILSTARCFGLQAWSWAWRSLHFLWLGLQCIKKAFKHLHFFMHTTLCGSITALSPLEYDATSCATPAKWFMLTKRFGISPGDEITSYHCMAATRLRVMSTLNKCNHI